MITLFNYETYEKDYIETHKRLNQLEFIDIEKAYQNKTLFDFIIKKFDINTYSNEGGNCLLVALCDYMNLKYDTTYKPVSAYKHKEEYDKICKFMFEVLRKEHNVLNVWDAIKYKISEVKDGLIMFWNSKGNHAICKYNNKFYNNWGYRKAQNLKEIKNELGIIRETKTFTYINDEKCIKALLLFAINYKMIIKQ